MSEKALIRFFIITTIMVVVFRFMHLRGIVPDFAKSSLHRSFETVSDALAIGALGYLLKEKLSLLFSKYYRWYFLISVIMIILLLAGLNSSILVSKVGYIPRYLYNLIGIVLINVSMLFIMFFVMDRPNGTWFNKFLNIKLMVFIGLLSYSIYLWQQPWLFQQWDIPFYLRYVGIAA